MVVSGGITVCTSMFGPKSLAHLMLLLVLCTGITYLVLAQETRRNDAKQQLSLYVCPMHLDVWSTAPGTCVKCRMGLTKVDVTRGGLPGKGPLPKYKVDLETVP